MFKEVQLTLYDIFGYLLPGAVILLAGISLFWVLFWPNGAAIFPSRLPVLATTSLLFAAYLAGHLAQAVGNLFERFVKARRKLDDELPLSPELGKLFTEAMAARFGEHAMSLKPGELFALCDQTLVHHGSPGEREIFTYREGFYRGNAVALTLLALSFVARLVYVPVRVVLLEKSFMLGRGQLALAAVLTGISAWLCYRRFIRFAQYRYRSCFLRFLALSKSTPTNGKPSHGQD